MLQSVIVGIGGTIETEFIGGRPASCTVSIINADASVRVAAVAATPDSVNTTAAVATAAQDTTVTLTSAAGVVNDGRRYLFDGEDVTVRSVSGSVVTLWAPLALPHAIGASFAGVRVTYSVSAGVCAAEWWDAQAVWTPASGDPQTEDLNCSTRKIPINLIGLTDVREVEPKALAMISTELDLPRSFRRARNLTLLALGAKDRANSHIGVDVFRLVAGHQWVLDRRTECGDHWGEQMKIHEAERGRLIALALGQAPQSDGAGGTIPGALGAVFPDINLGTC